jgi:hypothetical protein
MSIILTIQKKIINQAIAIALDKNRESFSITLDTGEIIYGDIHSRSFQEYCKYTKTKKDLVPNSGPISPELMVLLPDGKGGKLLARIPINRIAFIQGIPPLITYPEGYLRNLPKNHTSSIFQHNYTVIKGNRFTVSQYQEKALLNIGNVGPINLVGFELIHADFDFFSRRNGGLNNLGISVWVTGASVGWKTELNSRIYKVLENRKNLRSKLSKWYRYRTEIVLKGRIQLEINQDTEMDGTTWKVYTIRLSKNGKTLPLLLDETKLQYPKEYLLLINQELSFFGEMRQIPIKIDGVHFDNCLQVRAIAYLPEEENKSLNL